MLGKLKKDFMRYINRDNIDLNSEFVDTKEYYSFFVFFSKLFCVWEDEKKFWMYFSPICVFISGSSAEIICTMSLIHYVKTREIHLITEVATYVLVLWYELLIVYSTMTKKRYYYYLIRALREDFVYICTKGLKYRERFFENQKFTFKVCVLSSIFTGCIGFGMSMWAVITLLVFIAIHGKSNVDEHLLPFPLLLFGYEKSSPGFEIIFFICLLFTFFHTYVYIFMEQSLILWIRQIMCKADVIIWSIEDLLKDILPTRNKLEEKHHVDLIRARFREIIIMHHSMFQSLDNFSSMFKINLLCEQKVGAPIICMTAYGFAEKLDDGEFHALLLILCIATVVLVFIPSFLCTLLLEKVQSVSDACWDTPFWNARPVVRPYLLLIMQRSMRQLPIVAAGFQDISLQTYSNMLTQAYSCFNMLRQSGK